MLAPYKGDSMSLIATILAAAYVWLFVSNFTSRVPGWIIHLTVIPLIAYLALHAPHTTQNVLGVAGGVMLVQSFFKNDESTRKLPVKRRRSNIPPPP
jgi:hypothetical protein